MGLKIVSFFSYFQKWNLRERLSISKNSKPKIWIHCASIGESKGVIGFILKEFLTLDKSFYLTTTSMNGYIFLKKNVYSFEWSQNIVIAMAPLDVPFLIRNLIQKQNIQKLYLYEMELWPSMVYTASQQKIEIEWISVRFTRKAERKYSLNSKKMSWLLNQIQTISTISQVDRTRLKKYTQSPVQVGLDYKVFFYLNQFKVNRETLPKKDRVLGFLSLHYQELVLFETQIPKLKELAQLIFIPRYSNEQSLFKAFLLKYDIEPYRCNDSKEHFLVTEFPMQNDFVSRCSHVFVGGSLIAKGGHNLIEPFLKGCFVFFGPFIEHQQWISEELLKLKATKKIEESQGLLDFYKYKLSLEPILEFKEKYNKEAS